MSPQDEPQGVSQLASAARKGKKSRPWNQDKDVLMRLESVAQMLLRGAKLWQIAEALDCSLSTAKRDVSRVRQLWQQETGDQVRAQRDASVAQLREVQLRAWQEYDNGKLKSPAWLRVVRDCELDIIALQGTRAAQVVDVQSKGQAVTPILAIEVVKDYGQGGQCG